jgi:hypothetical protein
MRPSHHPVYRDSGTPPRNTSTRWCNLYLQRGGHQTVGRVGIGGAAGSGSSRRLFWKRLGLPGATGKCVRQSGYKRRGAREGVDEGKGELEL